MCQSKDVASSPKVSAEQIKGFGSDMRELSKSFSKQFLSDPSYRKKELFHLRCVEASWWAALVIGFLTAPMCVNPVTAFFLSYAVFVRFTCIGHAVLHGGYSHTGNRNLHRGYFAQGGVFRRIRDWLDWIEPNGWVHEHNKLHHYALGEDGRDPDAIAHTAKGHYFFQNEMIPPFIRRVVAWIGVGCTWKILYYPLSNAERETRAQLSEEQKERFNFPKMCTLDIVLYRLFGALLGFGPANGAPTWYWCKVMGQYLGAIAPYFLVSHVLVPMIITSIASHFFGLDVGATAFTVWGNFILAEIMTNFHAFVTIVPNHTGRDLYVFKGECTGSSDEFFFRAAAGSADYSSSGHFTDVLLGYLNFQVEHHSFPHLSMYSQRAIMPMVESLCKQHGIPYVKENVFTRVTKMVEILIGADTQPFFGTVA